MWATSGLDREARPHQPRDRRRSSRPSPSRTARAASPTARVPSGWRAGMPAPSPGSTRSPGERCGPSRWADRRSASPPGPERSGRRTRPTPASRASTRPPGASSSASAVGNSPGPIQVGGGAVWVANTLDGTVSRIDPASERRGGRHPRGRRPGEPGGRRRRRLGRQRARRDRGEDRPADERRRGDDRDRAAPRRPGARRQPPVGRRGRRVGRAPGRHAPRRGRSNRRASTSSTTRSISMAQPDRGRPDRLPARRRQRGSRRRSGSRGRRSPRRPTAGGPTRSSCATVCATRPASRSAPGTSARAIERFFRLGPPGSQSYYGAIVGRGGMPESPGAVAISHEGSSPTWPRTPSRSI